MFTPKIILLTVKKNYKYVILYCTKLTVIFMSKLVSIIFNSIINIGSYIGHLLYCSKELTHVIFKFQQLFRFFSRINLVKSHPTNHSRARKLFCRGIDSYVLGFQAILFSATTTQLF